MRAAAAFFAFALGGSAAVALAQPQSFKDCTDCPEMVVLPAGSFVMGAPDDEPDRQRWDGPPTQVVIDKPFALGKYEVTIGEFAAFMRATTHQLAGKCRVFTGTWDESDDADWDRPNYAVTERHPVVCVGWYDALAYVNWLNTKGKHIYYIPSEAEFEYANRAGHQTIFPWGTDRGEICAYANIGDQRVKDRHSNVDAHVCDDGYEFAAPVGSFPPNDFGLHDAFGNVWEWVFDCWTFNHDTATGTAAPVTGGENCFKRMIKGSGYESVARYARLGARGRDDIPDFRNAVIGFRVAARIDQP